MINLTPNSTSPATLPSYCTQAEAAGIAAGLLDADSAAYLAASSDDQVAALAAATADIDQAMRYQGRKYAEVASCQLPVVSQVLEFPRAVDSCQLPVASGFATNNYPLATSRIWDWDIATSTAIVPANVKRACVIQANARISGRRDARLDARHDGVAGQSGGGLSENYGGEVNVLCRRAHEIMSVYRLMSGELV